MWIVGCVSIDVSFQVEQRLLGQGLVQVRPGVVTVMLDPLINMTRSHLNGIGNMCQRNSAVGRWRGAKPRSGFY